MRPSRRPRLELRVELFRHLPHRSGKALHHLGKLVIGASERRREQRLVPRESVARRHGRVGDQTLLESNVVHPACRALLWRQEGFTVARIDVLDPQQEPSTSDLVNEGQALEGTGELVSQLRATLTDALDESLLLQDVEDLQTDGA